MTDIQRPQRHRPVCFLSLPQAFSTVRQSLKATVSKIGGDTYYIIAAEGDTLHKEIKRGIDSSSLLIADLSSPESGRNRASKGPRPAIMWEIGYSSALELGQIFICQKKDRGYVPSVLQGFHLIYYDIDNLDPMLKEVEGALEKIIVRKHGKETRIFHSKCYVDRSSSDLEVRYLRAKETIKILELNLETVAEQVPTIVRALQKSPTLAVQILTLNPFSTWAEDRANQLAELPLRYRRKLYRSIEETWNGLAEIPTERWGLRIYDTFPTQIMFQVDDALIHSIIALGRKSRNMLHFEIQRSQPNASDTFEAHFAQLWSSGERYNEWREENKIAVEQLLSIGESPNTKDASGE